MTIEHDRLLLVKVENVFLMFCTWLAIQLLLILWHRGKLLLLGLELAHHFEHLG